MPLHFDEHERAFAERRVDAVVTYEPARTRLLAAGARIVFDSSRIPQEIMDVLAVRESWIRSREDTLRAVVSGWLEVADALQTRPDVVTPALAHRLRLPAEEVVASFAGIELLGLAANRSLLGPPAGIVPVARRLADTMVAHGFLDHAPDVSALADATIVGGLPDGAPR
jgi:NitT/TauT family transport system substrate-binding protein